MPGYALSMHAQIIACNLPSLTTAMNIECSSHLSLPNENTYQPSTLGSLADSKSRRPTKGKKRKRKKGHLPDMPNTVALLWGPGPQLQL